MKIELYKTPHQTAVEGFTALVERLGPGGALQFLHQYEVGHGNYTEERRDILRGVTLADVRKSLLPKRQRRRKRSS